MSTLNAGETLQPLKPLQNNLIFDSSGNMVGIQNDRANGTDLRLNGGSAGTFSSLVVQAAGTFDLYNTADQTTNYERLRASFVANTATLITQQGGTGIFRAISLASGNGGALTIAGLPSNTNGMSFTYGVSNSSGTQTLFKFQPTIVQSGTASYTGIDIDVQEFTTGSGTKLLQRWAVGGTARALVDNSGTLSANTITAAGILGLGGTGLGSIDVALYRDAADTLALRRLTNAQTFRVYNTYTDASNYERGIHAWVGNTLVFGTEQAGTGASRDLAFRTAGTDRWFLNTAGHFIANADNTYDIGASGANRPRNVYLGSWMRMATTTVASLPAAATAAAGARMFVTDANATTFASIVAAGGANIVPVYSDGTNWRIG